MSTSITATAPRTFSTGAATCCSFRCTASPEDAFPYFLGFADERGEGEGEGFNRQLSDGAGDGATGSGARRSLRLLKAIHDYGPDAVVVSLGVDTFKDDPISFFKLQSKDFTRYGARIAGLKRPTLFVMEGGYAVEAIGVNTVNVLEGFLGR